MDTKEDEYRIVPLRIDREMHKKLKKASFLTETHMSDIMRSGINMKLEELKKILTNAKVSV